MPSRDNYRFGRMAEQQVAAVMKAAGCVSPVLMPGSRGPADVVTGPCTSDPRGYVVQVKSTRRDVDPCARVTNQDVRRLKRFARQRNQRPILACVRRDGLTEFRVPASRRRPVR